MKAAGKGSRQIRKVLGLLELLTRLLQARDEIANFGKGKANQGFRWSDIRERTRRVERKDRSGRADDRLQVQLQLMKAVGNASQQIRKLLGLLELLTRLLQARDESANFGMGKGNEELCWRDIRKRTRRKDSRRIGRGRRGRNGRRSQKGGADAEQQRVFRRS
jgi:hypothetical protein